jgi:hypothetical protein
MILTLWVSKGKVENWAFLDYYAASSDNSLPTFRDNLSVPSSRVKNLQRESGTLVRGLCRRSVGGDIKQRKGCAFACHKGTCRSRCVGYTLLHLGNRCRLWSVSCLRYFYSSTHRIGNLVSGLGWKLWKWTNACPWQENKHDSSGAQHVAYKRRIIIEIKSNNFWLPLKILLV